MTKIIIKMAAGWSKGGFARYLDLAVAVCLAVLAVFWQSGWAAAGCVLSLASFSIDLNGRINSYMMRKALGVKRSS